MGFEIQNGDRFYVKHRGYDLWHELLALSQVTGREWIIGTPDFDLYP